MYWLAITPIEAQDMLLKLSVADYPHLKEARRERLHRSLTEKAYPASFRKDAEPITTKQLAERLRAASG